MDGNLRSRQFLLADIRRVDDHTVKGTVDVGVAKLVSIRRSVEVYSLPLSRHSVVRQVVKHPVESVAPKRDGLLVISLGDECAVDIQSGIAMEVECLSGYYSQDSSTVHFDASIDDKRASLRVDSRVMSYFHAAGHERIPSVGVEMDLLRGTVA